MGFFLKIDWNKFVRNQTPDGRTEFVKALEENATRPVKAATEILLLFQANTIKTEWIDGMSCARLLLEPFDGRL
jgi:hypothetical protein